MDVVTLGLFVLGFFLLLGGAEWLVRGAAHLAVASGISPLVIGLTVVAFGTSAPELAVSVQSALAGQGDIALGNVVGSNILNILFILGLAALIAPLTVSAQLVRLDVPLMIGASLLVWWLGSDGVLSLWDGGLLCVGIVVYTVFSIIKSRRESAAIQDEYAEEFGDPGKGGMGWNLLLIGAGLVLLVLGARWLVDGAVVIARWLGVSELIIGLTVVAVGTSLPEVAASVMASLRGQRDIAVGNVVGSNLFNLLLVLGAAAVVSPEGLPVPETALNFDIPVMTAVAVACLPIFFTSHRIDRWEGALFLGYYAVYTAYLILNAMQHDSLGAFSATMLWFVIPLTVITLLVLVARSARHQNM